MREKAAQWTPPTAEELAALDRLFAKKNNTEQ
jgi:hypothetical protein